MVTPKNNLPPESQQWRRDIERRLASLELVASNLSTATKSSDIRLGSLNHAMRSLGDTVQRLSDTVTTVNATVASLDNQIHFSSNDVSYFEELLTTTVSDVLPFDDQYDQSVTVSIPSTHSSSVNATVWYGSWLAFDFNAGPTSTLFGAIQVYLEQIEGTNVQQLYWDAVDLDSHSYAPSYQRKSSPPLTVLLDPGKTYTFRTRRQRDYTRISESTFDTTYQTYPIVVLLQFQPGA